VYEIQRQKGMMVMFKKKRLVVTVLAVSLLVTGCSSVPDLSDVHRDMEAEYMAGILLKYDKNNQDMLDYDRSVLEPTPTPVPTQQPAASKAPSSDTTSETGGSTDSQTTSVETVDADVILSKGGIRVRQEQYQLKKSYDSSYSTITAREGKKLFVVKFLVKNTSGATKKVNLMKRNLTYSLEIDGASAGSPLMTILENDLQYMNSSLEGGKSKEEVLIFEVSSSTKVQNAVLNITEGTKTAQMTLK
jgi:hypothetical protein